MRFMLALFRIGEDYSARKVGLQTFQIENKKSEKLPVQKTIQRGYYTVAPRYEFYFRVLKKTVVFNCSHFQTRYYSSSLFLFFTGTVNKIALYGSSSGAGFKQVSDL